MTSSVQCLYCTKVLCLIFVLYCDQHLRDAAEGMHPGVHFLRSVMMLQHRCRGTPIGASSYNSLIALGLFGPSETTSSPLSGSILSPLSEWLGDKRLTAQALPLIDIVLNLLHMMAPEVRGWLISPAPYPSSCLFEVGAVYPMVVHCTPVLA